MVPTLAFIILVALLLGFSDATSCDTFPDCTFRSNDTLKTVQYVTLSSNNETTDVLSTTMSCNTKSYACRRCSSYLNYCSGPFWYRESFIWIAAVGGYSFDTTCAGKLFSSNGASYNYYCVSYSGGNQTLELPPGMKMV